MKTKLFFLFVIVFSHFANAQEVNCANKEKQLSQFIADSDYAKALDLWNDAKTSCPTFSEKMYVLGSQVLQYNIEIAKPEDKEKNVRELIKLYTQLDKNFPNNKEGSFEKSAMALYNNKAGEEVEIYMLLDKAFELQKSTFTNPQAIFIYFNSFFDKYKSENSSVTIEKLLTKYTSVASLVEENSQKFPEKADENGRVLQGMNSLMDFYLICDNLIPFAQKNFEANKSNPSWLGSIAKSLSVSCKSAPIFETISLELHKVKPSSKSAYYLATFYLNTGKQEKATDYFTQSISLSNDKMEKATTAYVAASVLASSDKGKAKEMILLAIDNNPSNGKNYIFLADLYANGLSECASNDDEKKAIYKLASDTVLKAAQAEPRLKTTSESMSKRYLQNVVVDKKSKVKSVYLGCWINQTVQF